MLRVELELMVCAASLGSREFRGRALILKTCHGETFGLAQPPETGVASSASAPQLASQRTNGHSGKPRHKGLQGCSEKYPTRT